MSKEFVFGARSQGCLDSCAPRLQAIARRGLELSPYDFGIITGHRNRTAQTLAVEEGNSKTEWPDSMHNRLPSHAIDFVPAIKGKAVDWEDTHIFAVVAGCIMAAAIELGGGVRWGGDWDSDGSTRDQTLMDWGHIELADPATLAD